jgi:hypothetical protein
MPPESATKALGNLPLLTRLWTAYLAGVTARLAPPSLAYFQTVAEKVDRIVLESYPGSAGVDKRVAP